MRLTIEQLERMLASKTVQSSPKLKALYGERLARLKQVRSARQERRRELARRTSTSTKPKQPARKEVVMSLSFRPVREEWGEASSCFIDADEVVRLLRRVADSLDIPSEHHNYADNVSVWLEDGYKLLDYIESRRFTARSVAALTGLKAQALKPLVGNMKTLARTWRKAIGSHGELHFYVDAF